MGKQSNVGFAMTDSIALARAARDEAKELEARAASKGSLGDSTDSEAAATGSGGDDANPVENLPVSPRRTSKRTVARTRRQIRTSSSHSPEWSQPKEQYFNFRIPPEAKALLDDLVYARKKSDRPHKTQELGIEMLQDLFRKEGLLG